MAYRDYINFWKEKRPAISSQFSVSIPGYSGLSDYIMGGDFPGGINVDSQPLSVGNGHEYVPTDYDCKGPSINFVEDSDGNVKSVIQRWMKKIVNTDGTFKPPASYKQTITLNLEKFKVEYVGCYPLGMASYSLDMNPSFIILAVQFSCDSIK